MLTHNRQYLDIGSPFHVGRPYRTIILMLYALSDSLLLKSVIGCTMLSGMWIPGLAFIPIALYNGQRGFIQGSYGKYCFYAFYPLHLMILYFYKTVCGI